MANMGWLEAWKCRAWLLLNADRSDNDKSRAKEEMEVAGFAIIITYLVQSLLNA